MSASFIPGKVHVAHIKKCIIGSQDLQLITSIEFPQRNNANKRYQSLGALGRSNESSKKERQLVRLFARAYRSKKSVKIHHLTEL